MKAVVKRARRGRLRRNQWVVSIVAGNGQKLFTSETYANRGDALHAVELLQHAMVSGMTVEARD